MKFLLVFTTPCGTCKKKKKIKLKVCPTCIFNLCITKVLFPHITTKQTCLLLLRFIGLTFSRPSRPCFEWADFQSFQLSSQTQLDLRSYLSFLSKLSNFFFPSSGLRELKSVPRPLDYFGNISKFWLWMWLLILRLFLGPVDLPFMLWTWILKKCFLFCYIISRYLIYYWWKE